MESSPAPPEPPDPRVGNVLQGRYRILARIASGAMGVVYRGERVQLGRPVAVKFLHPWIAAQQAFLSRFETEARAMSRLAHPHCVSVIDFGIEGSPYLVMDFVTGRTLRNALDGGRLPVPRALHVVRQLLAGLAHAHAQGIVHRDLKPENIVLGEEAGLEDHLRILDFGLAKLRDGPAMTAGLAVGTPSYMSPEQTGAGGAIDARSDLYAVGVLLFELLTGRKPFQAEKIGDLILMHREMAPPRLRDVAPEAGLSDEMEAVVARAMAKFPEERFQMAGEFVAALDATPEASAAGVARRNGAGLPPSGRPVASPDATIIDSLSAIQRMTGGAGAAPLGGDTKLDASPAGAAAPDPPAAAEAASGAGVRLDRRLVAVGAGFLAAAALAILVGRMIGREGPDTRGALAPASAPAASHRPAASRPAAPAPPEKPAEKPVQKLDRKPGPDPRLDEARRLIARREWDQAVALLNAVRADDPDGADAPYLLATVYFEGKRWGDGLAAAQIAVRKNPALKADPDLIKAVIDSLASDRSYERSQAFLRSSGAAATPFLRDAARRHENRKVRERAADMLQGGGRGGFSRSGGGASGPSRSSGGSLFKR